MTNRHIDGETLTRLKNGGLPMKEKLEVMAHVAACSRCATSFAETYDDQELLPLPPGFIEEMALKCSPSTLLPLRPGAKKKDKKKEFFAYSLRVSVAACMALVLLFSGSFSQGSGWVMEQNRLKDDIFQTNKMTEQLRDFSDRMLRFDFSKQN